MVTVDQKQKLLIEYITSNYDLFVKVVGVLKPEYFDEPLDVVVNFVLEYFFEFKNVPNKDIIQAETTVQLKDRDVSQDEFEYVVSQVEQHCKNAAMKIAILESVDDLEQDNYGAIEQKIRNALMVSLDKDMGTDHFDNPSLRLMQMQQKINSRSIGWPSVDNVIDGVKRGELVIFAGGTGSGKSVTLANVANNLASQGLHAVYFSLELNEPLIAKRLDSIITSIATKEIFNRISDVDAVLQSVKSQYGSLIVKKMPNGCSANQLNAYLLEYAIQYQRKPDVIVVDYLDLMKPNAGVNKSGNVFDTDKQITEELRNVFDEHKVYGFSASQLNRSAVDVKEKNLSMVAGGISKANTADVFIAIERSEEQINKGEIVFQLLKVRNAELTPVPITLQWNNKTLRITDNGQMSNAPTVTTSPKAKAGSKLNDILKKNKKS